MRELLDFEEPSAPVQPPTLSLKGTTREQSGITQPSSVVVWPAWKIVVMVGVILVLVGIIGYMFYKADKQNTCPVMHSKPATPSPPVIQHSSVKMNSDLTGNFKDLHKSHKPPSPPPQVLQPVESPMPEKTPAIVEEVENEIDEAPPLILDSEIDTDVTVED